MVEEYRSCPGDLPRCANNCRLQDLQKRLMFVGEMCPEGEPGGEKQNDVMVVSPEGMWGGSRLAYGNSGGGENCSCGKEIIHSLSPPLLSRQMCDRGAVLEEPRGPPTSVFRMRTIHQDFLWDCYRVPSLAETSLLTHQHTFVMCRKCAMGGLLVKQCSGANPKPSSSREQLSRRRQLLHHLQKSMKGRVAIGDRPRGNTAAPSRGRVVNVLTTKASKTYVRTPPIGKHNMIASSWCLAGEIPVDRTFPVYTTPCLRDSRWG